MDDGGFEEQSVPVLLRDVRFDADKTLVSQIFEIIRRLIITVRLRPGQKISENDISEALTASKNPVREALIRLEDAGLVTIVPKSGTFVAPIRVDRYIDACFIRLQLETGAVRRAAVSAQGDLAALDGIIEQQVAALEAGEYGRFFALDEALHHAIFEISGVGGVWETARRAQTGLCRVRHLKRICGIRRGPLIVEQHRDISAAIRGGSPDGAEAALIRHIGSLEQEIASLSMTPGLFDHIENLNAKQPRQRRPLSPAARPNRERSEMRWPV